MTYPYRKHRSTNMTEISDEEKDIALTFLKDSVWERDGVQYIAQSNWDGTTMSFALHSKCGGRAKQVNISTLATEYTLVSPPPSKQTFFYMEGRDGGKWGIVYSLRERGDKACNKGLFHDGHLANSRRYLRHPKQYCWDALLGNSKGKRISQTTPDDDGVRVIEYNPYTGEKVYHPLGISEVRKKVYWIKYLEKHFKLTTSQTEAIRKAPNVTQWVAVINSYANPVVRFLSDSHDAALAALQGRTVAKGDDEWFK